MLALLVSVTRNECTDAINVILDAIAVATNNEVLSEVSGMDMLYMICYMLFIYVYIDV